MKIYLARDKDGELTLFTEKPYHNMFWRSATGEAVKIDNSNLPEIKSGECKEFDLTAWTPAAELPEKEKIKILQDERKRYLELFRQSLVTESDGYTAEGAENHNHALNRVMVCLQQDILKDMDVSSLPDADRGKE